MPAGSPNSSNKMPIAPKGASQTPATIKPNPKPAVIAKKKKTKITVKFDAGFPNNLFIRGRGADLSWDKGIPLNNVQADEWIWETDRPFATCEFKILINDELYEAGDNHVVQCGAQVIYTPRFSG